MASSTTRGYSPYYTEINAQDLNDPGLNILNQMLKAYGDDIARLQSQVGGLKSTSSSSPSSSSTATGNFVDAEAPAGATGTRFTLQHTPNPATSLILVWNGLVRSQGSDYTISGNAITTSVSVDPVASNMVCWYRY